MIQCPGPSIICVSGNHYLVMNYIHLWNWIKPNILLTPTSHTCSPILQYSLVVINAFYFCGLCRWILKIFLTTIWHAKNAHSIPQHNCGKQRSITISTHVTTPEHVTQWHFIWPNVLQGETLPTKSMSQGIEQHTDIYHRLARQNTAWCQFPLANTKPPAETSSNPFLYPPLR